MLGAGNSPILSWSQSDKITFCIFVFIPAYLIEAQKHLRRSDIRIVSTIVASSILIVIRVMGWGDFLDSNLQG